MFPICTYFKVLIGSEEKKAERCEARSGSETRYCVCAIDAVYSINAYNCGIQSNWRLCGQNFKCTAAGFKFQVSEVRPTRLLCMFR